MSTAAPSQVTHLPDRSTAEEREQFQLMNQILHSPVIVPLLSLDRFSTLTGFDKGVVDGWVHRGYLPTCKVGRRTAVNMVKLNKQLGDLL